MAVAELNGIIVSESASILFNLNVIIKVRLLSRIVDFYQRLSGGAVARAHVRKLAGRLTLARQRGGLPQGG